MKTSSQHKRHFSELATRIASVRRSLEQTRQEEIALSDILKDLIKERDKAILDSRGVVTAPEVGDLLGVHESTVRSVLVRELRRNGMGIDTRGAPQR